MHTCIHCSAKFEITKEDLEFYKKVSPVYEGKTYEIPAPRICPDCRIQLRLSFRNERNFYHRKCDATGRQMISLYPFDSPYKVYEQSVWWSDQFDPLEYGRDFDFQKPFFEQWQELNLTVPRVSIHNAKSENCEYTNYSSENRNCYLVVGGLEAEDCYYSYRVFYSRNLVDCYDMYTCELCYECRECKEVYGSKYCANCFNCSQLEYCNDCIGCSDCYGCIGLRNQKFHILNRKFSETEYRKNIQYLRDHPEIFEKEFKALQLQIPVRANRILNCQECTGDNLVESRQCRACFTVKKSEDCSYCSLGEGNKSCSDCNHFDNCELQWNSANLEKNYNVICGNLAWYVSDSAYVTSCFNSNHLFGCIGMKKHSYCIFNKQYTKEEYEKLVPKIIEHMQKTGEWGSYYPAQYSPFGYNETVACEEYPLSEKEAHARGWNWNTQKMESEGYLGPQVSVPEDIAQVPDEITQQILTCAVTQKPYKIIPQELAFYRQMNIAIPVKSPDQRHKERMALRNPWKLWDRKCAKCSKAIRTSYSPDHPEKVFCEECYLATVS